jgi:hypothetical protein
MSHTTCNNTHTHTHKSIRIHMWDIVFLANAIGQLYEDFLVPFTYFALATHPNGFVEIVVESVEKFEQRHAKALDVLSTIHSSSRFVVRAMQNKVCKRHIPNTYRFLEVPQEIGKYTYIMDVDVMLLENIVGTFEANWPPGCVVNNMIRCNDAGESLQRLTGMHMVRTVDYYSDSLRKEQQNLSQTYSHPNTNDEYILHGMVQKCHRLPPLSHRFRPILGIHFSPNRGKHKCMGLCTSRHYADVFALHASRNPELFALPVFTQLSAQLRDDFQLK